MFFLAVALALATVPVNLAKARAAAPDADGATAVTAESPGNAPVFNVTAYVVNDNGLLATNISQAVLSKYTGTNVSLVEIVQAASDLQAEYRNHGYPMTSIAVAREQIANGVVTLNVFQTAIPQIVVSGVRYYSPTNTGIASGLPAIAPVLVPPTSTAPVVTNVPPPAITNLALPAVVVPAKPASPAEIAQARAALFKKMVQLDTEKPDTRIHVVSTNAGPHFAVQRYRIDGNTILSPQDMAMVLTNIDGAYGTNVGFDGVRTVVQQLQKAYRDRGYITVAVGLPRQKLTNATVKVQITEGRLEAINVHGNVYFSSNNVMRTLPSLHTNMILNANVFQAELNRANANQDRQIYPVIGPGPEPGSSALTLNVKDQLPLHGKVDFNNQSSPGTPDLRVNASAVEDNLWQQEHSLGVQYGFSPEVFKRGEWNFYDNPAIADYSGFYRLPLGGPQPIEDEIESSPGSFGYDEAKRQFRLPPPSGQTELNLYASRATIDTGVQVLSSQNLPAGTNNGTINQETVQEGITINEDIGFQLSQPLPQFGGVASTFSGGLDYKTLSQQNAQTNLISSTLITTINGVTRTNISIESFPVPITQQTVYYLPLELNYNAAWNDSLGPASAGLGMSVNLWFSSSTTTNGANEFVGRSSLQNITGSHRTTGSWVIFKPSFSQTILSQNNWTTLFRADGQWASEPLISTEQYGIGGVNSVRGYHEGEIFGDSGWHASLEEDTPPHIVGMVYDGQPLTVRGTVYMDAATAYLLDPQPGAPASTKLWSAGVGFGASIGPHWQAQFLFSVPLVSTSLVPRYNPYFNFDLTAQF
ncbi:MAG TPA: POTRA domain-containing protein [Candidatus Acidoferrum sp.]|nr:POTRA domain-containing protein [Candidatus Acidoferrum sp.]